MRDGISPQPARVLLLEDDPALMALLVELLAGEGFEVTVCQSYARLREALDAVRCPVVVADFWGASQARLSHCERDQIRELGRLTPTVLLTGRAWAGANSADDLNVTCILCKPFALEELLAEVRCCLAGNMHHP